MASNFGTVAYVQPPTLKGVTQPDLIRFETEYSTYKEKVANMNIGRNDADKIPVETIRDCMDGPTLQALCIMGKINGATTLEQATPTMVEAWFTAAHTAAPRDLSERIHSALTAVRYKTNSVDPAGAALTFCLDAIKALDRNNASEIMSNGEKAEYLIDKLEDKLEPPLLRERMKLKRSTWTKEEKGSIAKFQECISALAVDVHQNEVARSRIGGKPDKKKTKKERDGNDEKDKDVDDDDKRLGVGKGKRKRPLDGKKDTLPDCLNPDCKQKHLMKDCENTPKEMKKKLLDDFFEKKKAKKIKVLAKMEDHSDKEVTIQSGRYIISLEDSVQAKALGDTGADVSVMPSQIFAKVRKAEPSLHETMLDAPISLQLADASKHVKLSRSAKVTITIHLPGSNIPVRFRDVEFFIADFEGDDVLLGRPFLESIGFNLDEHLKGVSKAQKDYDNKLEQGTYNSNGTPRLSSMKYQGLSYQDTDDDPIELPESMAAGIGEDSETEIQEAFTKIIEEADKNEISESGKAKVKRMLEEYRDVFHIKLGYDKPAKVPALEIQQVPNARPFKTPQRRYSPVQTAFINSTVRDLERVGAVRRNPSAKWASPALAVPKPGSSKLRFTVDLRGVNARTVPVQSAMPHFESKLQQLAGSTCFAKLDLAHGYWQIPLAEASQELMSIQTPAGVYTPLRLLQGGSDSGNHFQAVLQNDFSTVNKLLQWIDDFLLHAAGEDELLHNLEQFLRICKDINLKVHAEKTTFFAREVQFCGREISAAGIRHHPRHFESLLNMKRPTMGGELQQLMCATNWMRTSLPEYATVVAPLHNLLENVYKLAGKRTKRKVQNISLGDLWGEKHEAAFSTIKQQLAAAVKLAHVKEDHLICLFTDASESHWASVLTQIPAQQRKKAVEDQDHEPLCFLSGSFSGASRNWGVPEKEGFAIVESMTRLDHIVMGREVNICTDHANLVYIYDPHGRNPGLPRHTASKLMRWAMKLSAYRYLVEHLPGERNVWADLLSRWAVRSHDQVRAERVAANSLLLAPINPGADERFDQPNNKDVRKSQESSKRKAPKEFRKVDRLWQNGTGVVWIPEDDKLMRLRVVIAAHCGPGGHRGQDVTVANVRTRFTWAGLKQDVKEFVESCLHCACAKSGKVVPRPLGHALHAEEPNKLLHFDFLYMAPSETEHVYILILKDDHSGYVWLTPTKAADAETAADTLIKWFTTFGIVEQWVSDRGSHYRNELIANLREKLRASHHFTLAYCPWSNGTVEVVCREVLRACRALLSEFQLPLKCWPEVVPIIQSALNNAILQRLGGRCPQTAFTGLKQTNPISTLITRQRGALKVKSMDEVRVRQCLRLDNIQGALQEMHRDVAERNTASRTKAVEAHNRKVGVRPVNFDEGDYVLRGIMERERVKKPALRWRGPYVVVRCLSDYIFVVQDLMTGEEQQVHGRRLKFFRNSSFEVTEEVKEHLDYKNDELLVVDKIEDIRMHKEIPELLVLWKGFGEEESDWVQLESMREDVPVLVKEALESFAESGTERQRKIVESL